MKKLINNIKEGTRFYWKIIKTVFKCNVLINTIRLILTLIQSSIPVGELVVLGKLINSIVENKGIIKDSYIWLLLLLTLIAIQQLLQVLDSFLKNKVHKELELLLNKKIIKKIASLKYSEIENEAVCQQRNRINNTMIDDFENGYESIIDIFTIIYQVITIVIFISNYAWVASIVIVILVIPIISFSIRQGKHMYDEYYKADYHRRYADYLHRILMDRESVAEKSIFDFKDRVQKKWMAKEKKAIKIENFVDIKIALKMKGVNLIILLMAFLVILVLIINIYNHKLDVGIFVSLVNGILNLTTLLSWSFVQKMCDIGKETMFIREWEKVFSLEEEEGALDEPGNKIDVNSIEFVDVSFKYPGTDKYILNNFSAKFEKNKCYAIVGKNGVGKTTFAKLLMKLYDNYSGEILINGIPIQQYKYADIKKTISVVSQDFSRYPLSIKDNILVRALGEKEEESKLKKVIKKIRLNSIVEELPNRMNTKLGRLVEGSVDLSGGEWQKIAIAGSLYSDANIRVLDEPTASLDPFTETEIYKMFHEAVRETTILITHRLGATKTADEILLIEDGRVKEKGSFSELCDLKGIFWSLYDEQKSIYQ